MDTATTIYSACFVFHVLHSLWVHYLSFRQYRKCVVTTNPPIELVSIWDETRYRKSRLYAIDKGKFRFVTDIFDQFVLTLTLVFNFIPSLWFFSGTVCSAFGWSGEIVKSIVFIFFTITVCDLSSLPFSFYNVFVIEEKHGFNKQTVSFFFKDKLKAYIVTTAISLPMTALILWIIKNGGDHFVSYLMLFLTLFMFLMMTIYPEFIAPLFDKYTSLPDGELKTAIEQLADSIQYPLKSIYVVQGSKRSSHGNAYLYGFWKNKRIVLYDTLLSSSVCAESEAAENDEKKQLTCDASKKPPTQGLSNDEVVAVVGHELGHWKLWHSVTNLIIIEISMLFQLNIFALLYKMPAVYNAFGFYGEMPIIVGLTLIFAFIYAPLNMISGVLLTSLTRRMEYAADAFSAKLGLAAHLKSGLINLSLDNLSFPVHDWLYSMWYYSHPSLLERITALSKYE